MPFWRIFDRLQFEGLIPADASPLVYRIFYQARLQKMRTTQRLGVAGRLERKRSK